MGKRGPRPRTASELKLSGSHRADRHGARGENIGFPKGRPEPPRRLTAEEQEIWDYVCNNVASDLLSPADRDSLLSLCWWHCYAETLERKVLEGIDDKAHKKLKDAQQERRLLWIQFGLMPVARSRMLPTGPGEEKEENPLIKLMRIREQKRKPG